MSKGIAKTLACCFFSFLVWVSISRATGMLELLRPIILKKFKGNINVFFGDPMQKLVKGQAIIPPSPSAEERQKVKQAILSAFELSDIDKTLRNEVFDTLLDRARYTTNANYNHFLQPLVTYVSSGNRENRARWLLEKLIAQDYPYEIMYFLTHLESNATVTDWFCQKIKDEKIVPPISRKVREPFASPHLPSRMPPHNKILRNIPFDNNHLPVLWVTNEDMQIRHFNIGKNNIGISYNIRDAVYMDFETALHYSNWLVVASKSLNCALFSSLYGIRNNIIGGKKHREKMKERIKNDWEVYQVPESQYYVWVPKEQTHRYRDILNLEKLTTLKPIGHELEREHIASCPLWITSKNELDEHKNEYSGDDPKKIFKPHTEYTEEKNKRVVIDLLIAGHGEPGKPPIVAGIPIGANLPENKRLTSLLNYFNDNLLTGTVATISCSTGGSNKLLLQEISAGVPIQYNYNLILNSISDKPILAKHTFFADKAVSLAYYNAQVYFANAAQLENGKASMTQLCRDFAMNDKSHFDLHGFATTPQVLLPGGHIFEECTKLDEILEVTSDMIMNKQPIEVKDKRLVLWHGADIQQTVAVYPNSNDIRTDAFTLEPPIVDFRIRQTAIRRNQPVVYPEFLPMQRTQPILHFKRIELQDSPSLQPGVLHFIRDAFFDVGMISHTMNIVIDELEGRSDITLQINNAKKQAGIRTPDTFAEIWKQSHGKRTVFKNVFIKIIPSKRSDDYAIVLSMPDPSNKRWTTIFYYQKNTLKRVQGNYPWHFEPLSNVVIPTVESVGEILPSKGSERFKKIKKTLAGHLAQVEEMQQPVSLSDDVVNYPNAAFASLENALNRMELAPLSNDQLIRFQGLIHALEHSSEETRETREKEFLREFRNIENTVPANKNPQFKAVLEREFVRAVLRERKAIRETIAAKMNIGKELAKEIGLRLQRAGSRPQRAADVSRLDSIKFGGEVLKNSIRNLVLLFLIYFLQDLWLSHDHPDLG